ncbi:hypothetical protein ETAA8_03090 [Anatilimnocola aggregata]|uniref:Uncharacterized protein n=1 Tax=Anatilimnocola aggregata TaxID=2528021 RepID=A0A517Y4X0_9BACT|nr:hypothetical protein ETAA8_03090 [Anatilimnocola aggregata]
MTSPGQDGGNELRDCGSLWQTPWNHRNCLLPNYLSLAVAVSQPLRAAFQSAGKPAAVENVCSGAAEYDEDKVVQGFLIFRLCS